MNQEYTPLPDYYAILQVHPEAEAEVIRAAYRMLMRKYHPDNLTAEQQQDIELIKRVRMINIAYDILSDPAQRAAYDLSRKRQAEKPSVLSTPGLETRLHLVCCARTRKPYKMLLARRAGSLGSFRVTGFELIDDINSGHQNGSPKLLPDVQKKSTPLRALLERVWPASKKKPSFDSPQPKFPSQSELTDLFATSDTLNFSEINWAGFNCPVCHAEFQFQDSKIANWCHCSACSRIYCSGNLHNTPMGTYGHCPWCGRTAKITRMLQPGEKADMPVRGELARSKGELAKLKGAEHKQLPDKNDG